MVWPCSVAIIRRWWDFPPHLGDKRVVTYGFGPEVDYQAVAVEQKGVRTTFRVLHKEPGQSVESDLGEISLSLPGRHNVANTLAAIAVARELDISWEVIQRALKHYDGVHRRFDLLLDTPERVVIDDYAHHPVEIRATLEAARDGFGAERRLVAIFQPHRYSRVAEQLQNFYESFHCADLVLVDRVYAAGEEVDPRFQGEEGQNLLQAGIHEFSRVETRLLPQGQAWQAQLETLTRPGDILLFLGAGDISRKARDFAAHDAS